MQPEAPSAARAAHAGGDARGGHWPTTKLKRSAAGGRRRGRVVVMTRRHRNHRCREPVGAERCYSAINGNWRPGDHPNPPWRPGSRLSAAHSISRRQCQWAGLARVCLGGWHHGVHQTSQFCNVIRDSRTGLPDCSSCVKTVVCSGSSRADIPNISTNIISTSEINTEALS